VGVNEGLVSEIDTSSLVVELARLSAKTCAFQPCIDVLLGSLFPNCVSRHKENHHFCYCRALLRESISPPKKTQSCSRVSQKYHQITISLLKPHPLLAPPQKKMSRSPSPTPSEQRRKDAEQKAREEEEQAKLPYKWTQTLEEADVIVPIPGNLKARDLIVELKKTHIKVAIKGQDPIIDVSSFAFGKGLVH
jgi:hypothetical protein